MFTGLIEHTAAIKKYKENNNGAIISIYCPFWSDAEQGDSIAVNGACLTVIKKDNDILSFEISNETLNKINKSGYQTGKLVNLERAMKVDSRFDGHIVTGHIDGSAKIENIRQDGFSYSFQFETDKEIAKYIIKKGSVAINGISLTVANIENAIFNVEIIPHTYKETNLQCLSIGEIVNIETDIFARYVEKFLSLNNNSSKISYKMLEENGYL